MSIVNITAIDLSSDSRGVFAKPMGYFKEVFIDAQSHENGNNTTIIYQY